MPIPDFGGLPPNADFNDLVIKINQLVQKLRNLMLNLDSLNVVSLTADNIDAGTINANVVTIGAEDGSKYYRLDTNGIVAYNGARNTLEFDLASGLLTLVEVLIKSADAYPYVQFDPTGNLFGVFLDANNYNVMLPSYSGAPGYFMYVGGNLRGQLYADTDGAILASPGDVSLSASGEVVLRSLSGRGVVIPEWGKLYSTGNATDLQSTLNAMNTVIAGKANAFSGVTGSYTAGTDTLHFSNGILTSVT